LGSKQLDVSDGKTSPYHSVDRLATASQGVDWFLGCDPLAAITPDILTLRHSLPRKKRPRLNFSRETQV
jgi:hypothetical protein